MKNYALLLLAGLALLSGCKDDTRPDPVPVLNGSDYYPISQGDFMVYEVNETIILGNDTTGRSYLVRERVDSQFVDLTGEPSFRLVRSHRDNATLPWLDDSVIVVKKTSQRIERQENNVRLVKLVFPMTDNRTWNANQMNAAEPKMVSYTQIAVPYTLQPSTGAVTYPATTLVQITADSSEIHAKTLYERYAKDAGLIERSLRDIKYETDPPELIGQFVIREATFRTEKLLERGHE